METRIYPTAHTFSITAINGLISRSFHDVSEHHAFTGIKKENDSFFYHGESHDFWELVFVEKGKATISEKEKIYELSEGQLIFHAPLEFHRFRVKYEDFPVKLKIISFSLDASFPHNLSKGVFTLSLEQKEQFSDVYLSIKNNYAPGWWCTKENVSPAEETSSVKMLESFLLGLIAENSPDKTQDTSTGARRYKEVIKVLKEHIHENLTVEDISMLSGLSISYIKKLFSLYAGCGVMQYFIKLKVLKAIKYLEENKSISEISELLGFSSSSYFSVVFKKETGKSPLHYKLK